MTAEEKQLLDERKRSSLAKRGSQVSEIAIEQGTK